MEDPKTQALAARFAAAIRTIASKPENLDNLESYLSYFFSDWMRKYASTPEGLTAEMESFADIGI